MTIKNGKVHYAWWILMVCILLNVTVHAIVMQVSGIYMVPMAENLGVPRSLLSLQSVLMSVGAVITAPIWGKLYKKYDARIVLSICTAVTALCTIFRSFMPNIWCILALSVVKGIFFTGNTVLPNSILLTAWFQKRRGFAISTASLGISVGGVIFTPLVERIISTMGWRVSDQVVGLIMLVVMLPCTLLIVRSTPKDKKLQPYGAEEMPAGGGRPKEKALYGMTIKEARSTPALYLLLFAIFGMTFATGAALQIPAYLTDIGYSTAVAAKAASAYMAVGIAGKLLLGQIVDKMGEKKASIYICGVSILAFVCFIFAANKAALIVMIVTYGLSSGITSVMPALLTSKIFGNRDYGPIYGLVLSVNRFGGVIGTVLVSLLFDLTGNYAIIWPACVATMVLTLISILYCMHSTQSKLGEAAPKAN